jgi:hypothetical protein
MPQRSGAAQMTKRGLVVASYAQADRIVFGKDEVDLAVIRIEAITGLKAEERPLETLFVAQQVGSFLFALFLHGTHQ